MVLFAGQARADVLEIGAEGAEWVAGPLVETPPESAGDYDKSGRVIFRQQVIQLPEIPAAYSAKIAELSARYGLSPQLLAALVWQESRWRADAVSPKGARGLAQLMPATAEYLGVDPDDPYANLEGGARYLREQIDRFDGDLEKALAAYNAGPGRVEQAQGIPRIRETQEYVASIMGRLNQQAQTQQQTQDKRYN
jgi:soluble lytic murein transglycosylase-like protein